VRHSPGSASVPYGRGFLHFIPASLHCVLPRWQPTASSR